MADPIRAAGALLWRPASHGVEICVVHRPAYDDWSLPKGKLDDDEHPLVAAVREVREETGYAATPQLRLPDVGYDLPDGRPKTVEFWLMRASDAPAGDIADPDEVDTIAWLSPDEATARLSYPADAALVAHAGTTVTAVTGLVRHAHAGERKKWKGDDALRPIDSRGEDEAQGLGTVLALFAPERLFAATPLRCKQTLEPLAGRVDRPIVIDNAFAEPADADDVPAKVKVAVARLLEVRDGTTAVICSQGKVMPSMLALLRGEDDREPYKTPKGGGWILSWSGDQLIGLSRL